MAPAHERDREQERSDAEAIQRLCELQAPAVKILGLVGSHLALHTLRVDCKNLGEEAFCTLATALDTNTSLRLLDCSSNYLTPHAAGIVRLYLIPVWC